jgi:hypothetical protein
MTSASSWRWRAAWLIVHQDMRRSARIRAVSAAITAAFHRQRKVLAEGTT